MGEWNGKFQVSEIQLIPLSEEINIFINISPEYNKFSASISYRAIDKITINLLNFSLAPFISKRKILYITIHYNHILTDSQFKCEKIDMFIGTNILSIVYKQFLAYYIENIL